MKLVNMGLLYSSMYFPIPSTNEEWLKVSQEFEDKWNNPFCLGAIDGKHINIHKHTNSGSEFFNYKHFLSVIMLAVVDANYIFLYVDIGSYGQSGDAGVFSKSTLKEAMDGNELGFLSVARFDLGNNVSCVYDIIGDDAFPLSKDNKKPYSRRTLTRDQRIFNYRLSRA